jgi:uncharacterized protein with HEPN domain
MDENAIGKATKCLSEEFKAENGDIEWRKIGGFRYFLISDYFKINFD